MNTTMAKLAFQGITFHTVQRESRTWLRLADIEAALGYSARGTALARIFSRHADEFTSSMTRVVKLATAGGKQAVRIFSLRGAHLLAMFARTDVAKAFRVWVLNILDAEVAKPVRQQVKSYSYPISMADPHDREFGNAMLSPSVLLDPRNRALELELLDRLSSDGHDVSGARIRIIAMREALERSESSRRRLENWKQRVDSLSAEMEAYGREQGKNVLFSRRVNERDAIEALVFADQLTAVRGAA